MTKANFSVNYTPAEIKLTNLEQLTNHVNKIAERYNGLVFTAEDKRMAEQSRSELLSIIKKLDNHRKEIKKECTKPIKEFEEEIKALVSVIDKPLEEIRTGLKEIEEGERLQREHFLNKAIAKIEEDFEVSSDDITRKDNWLNKSFYTSRGAGKRLKDEITESFEQAQKDYNHRLTQQRAVEAYCKAVDVDSVGWLGQLDYREAHEVIEAIDEYLETKANEKEIPEKADEKEEKTPSVKPSKKDKIVTKQIEICGTEEEVQRAVDLLESQGFNFMMFVSDEKEESDIFDEIGW